MSAPRFLSHQITIALLILRLVSFFSTTPALAASMADSLPRAVSVSKQQFSPEDFLALTNSARRQVGAPALRLNAQLNAAAEAKAEDMADKGYWDHFRPSDHKTPWAFIEEAGYTYRVAGENLAKGFRTPAGITHAWVNSPTHYANLVSPKYTEVGFACIQSTDEHGQPVLLTVEMFGSR